MQPEICRDHVKAAEPDRVVSVGDARRVENVRVRRYACGEMMIRQRVRWLLFDRLRSIALMKGDSTSMTM